MSQMAAKKEKKMSMEEIAALFQVNVSDLVTPEQKAAAEEHDDMHDRITLEAESVVFYMETKNREAIFKRRVCTMCQKKFLSTYTGVSHCSRECTKEFLAQRGMKWNPNGLTEAERWGGTIPKIIGPVATEILQGMTFPDNEEETPPVETPTNSEIEDDESLSELLAEVDSVIQ